MGQIVKIELNVLNTLVDYIQNSTLPARDVYAASKMIEESFEKCNKQDISDTKKA